MAPGGEHPTRRARRAAFVARSDGAAIALLVVAAVVWCAPAFVHGAVFGSYDLALHFGLGAGSLTGVHNAVNGDTARQDAVWSLLAWSDVHSGHLPLWDPDVLTGLPLLGNVQSATASLPSLVSYLFPLRYAYSATVVLKLVIAGSGSYVAARVLRCSRPASFLAGVVGELAAPMAVWAGWPQAGVAAYAGWLVAAVLLVLEAPTLRRAGGLALVVALAAAGGFPEVLVILAVALVVLAAAVLIVRPAATASHPSTRRGRPPAPPPPPPARRCVGALVAAAAVGAMLSAPTWWPGIPVLARSVSAGRVPPQLPSGQLWLFLDPSYWGLPTANATWFGPSNFYETAAFVGPLVLGLALLAVLSSARDGRVLGLALAVVVVYALGAGIAPVAAFEHHLGALRSVAYERGLLVVTPLLGLLAAVGADACRRARPSRVLIALVATAVPLGLLLADALSNTLPAREHDLRLDGAWLAVVGFACLCLYGGARLVLLARRADGRGSGLFSVLTVGLGIAEAVTLVLATSTTSTWGSQFFPRTAAISAAVRSSQGLLVGLGGEHTAGHAVHLGLLADTSAAYGLREMAGYDAAIPRSLELAWADTAPAPDLARAEVAGDLTTFVPEISTPRAASVLGVSDVLEPLRVPTRLVDNPAPAVDAALASGGLSPKLKTGTLDALEWLAEQPSLLGTYHPAVPDQLISYLRAVAAGSIAIPAPKARLAAAALAAAPARLPALARRLAGLYVVAPPRGTSVVARLGDEVLYRFAGVLGASFESFRGGEVVQPLRYRGDASAGVTLISHGVQWVRLAIASEPGWTATVRGKPVPLRSSASSASLEIEVPSGEDRVVLTYWPAGLTAALGAAGIGLVVEIAMVLGPTAVRRRRLRRTT